MHLEKKSRYFSFFLGLGILFLFLPPVSISILGKSLLLYWGELFIFLAFLERIFSIAMGYSSLYRSRLLNISILLIFVAFLSFLSITNLDRFMVGILVCVEVSAILFMTWGRYIDDADIDKLIISYIASSVVLGVSVFYTIVNIYNMQFIAGNKIELDIGKSNYLASILLLSAFIVYTIIVKIEHKLLAKLIYSGIYVLIITSIIYTGSRSAIIISMILFPIFIVYDFMRNKKNRIKIIILSCAAFFCLQFFTAHFFEGMISTGRFEQLQKQSNLLERFTIFKEYFESFLLHPFFGNGLMNIKISSLNDRYMWAHNYILQYLGDTGIIGLLVYLLFLFTIWKTCNQAKQLKCNDLQKSFIIGFSRGFIIVLIHGLIEPNFGTKLFMIFVITGFGLIQMIIWNHRYYKHGFQN